MIIKAGNYSTQHIEVIYVKLPDVKIVNKDPQDNDEAMKIEYLVEEDAKKL